MNSFLEMSLRESFILTGARNSDFRVVIKEKIGSSFLLQLERERREVD